MNATTSLAAQNRTKKLHDEMENPCKTCELTLHFNRTKHDLAQINFMVIEKIVNASNRMNLEHLLVRIV